MSFWVYILRCADNSYYTGHTDNLQERIMKHQAGEVEGYTSTRLPVALVFAEEVPSREEALTSERRIKGWSRKKKEAMMRGDWAEVSRLARGKRPSTSSGRTDRSQGVIIKPLDKVAHNWLAIYSTERLTNSRSS